MRDIITTAGFIISVMKMIVTHGNKSYMSGSVDNNIIINVSGLTQAYSHTDVYNVYPQENTYRQTHVFTHITPPHTHIHINTYTVCV